MRLNAVLTRTYAASSIGGSRKVRRTYEGPSARARHPACAPKNIRVAGTRWQVFDFDDCGYGPTELDLANSLYFVLFDTLIGPDPDRYRHFRHNFLRGYQDRPGRVPTDAVLDSLITRRVLALARWLADPDTAPPGIRTASPEWRARLQSFIRGCSTRSTITTGTSAASGNVCVVGGVPPRVVPQAVV